MATGNESLELWTRILIWSYIPTHFYEIYINTNCKIWYSRNLC